MYQNTRSLHMTLGKKGTSKKICMYISYVHSKFFFKLINYIAFTHELMLQSHQWYGAP